MSEPRTKCSACGKPILQRTADRKEGLCAICYAEANATEKTFGEPVPPDLPAGLGLNIVVGPWASIDAIDWEEVENALVAIASHYVRAFGKHHASEQFYGFAFDCNADYCQVFACLNTREDLRRQVQRYLKKWSDSYGQMTLGQVEDQLRWSLGDWRYQSIVTDRFSEAWASVERALMDMMAADETEDIDFLERFADSFMNCACRAMVRLEASDAFEALNRTEDFATFVADHDELAETSWHRLNSVRRRGLS